MRKIINILSIAFALIIIILSCKENPDNSEIQSNQSIQISQSDQSTEQRILSFKADIESDLKSGSNYPIDTAVKYLESLINYHYGDIQNNFVGTSADSVFISGNLTDGEITQAEALTIYNEMIDSLSIQFQNLPTQNLHLVFADIYRKDSIQGSVTFVLTSLFGYGPQLSLNHFDEDDYWMFNGRENDQGGYCAGPNYGQETDKDAASEIRDRLRTQMGVLQTRHYTTDVLPVVFMATSIIVFTQPEWSPFSYVFINPQDKIPNDNMFDYLSLLKHSEVNPYDPCLIPDEMNFYTIGSNQILYEEAYIATEGLLGDRVVLTIEILGDHHIYALWHEYHCYYGVIHYNPNEPEPFN